VHDDRHYSCAVRVLRGTDDGWWWFTVSGDAQRYAPFQTSVTDTRESVEDRVIAFYANRLFQLSQPSTRTSQWSRRPAGGDKSPPAAS
jgi:hypothetical protein